MVVCKIRYRSTVGSRRLSGPLRVAGTPAGLGGRLFPVGCFRPLSYTHRPFFSGAHARPGSWANFFFPQNSFVWENKKIDSPPPNIKTILHAFFTCGLRMHSSTRRFQWYQSRRRPTPVEGAAAVRKSSSRVSQSTYPRVLPYTPPTKAPKGALGPNKKHLPWSYPRLLPYTPEVKVSLLPPPEAPARCRRRRPAREAALHRLGLLNFIFNLV